MAGIHLNFFWSKSFFVAQIRFQVKYICLMETEEYGPAFQPTAWSWRSAVKDSLIIPLLQTLSVAEYNIPLSIRPLAAGNPFAHNAVSLPRLHIYIDGNQTT